jgi:hypothetical protein
MTRMNHIEGAEHKHGCHTAHKIND